MPESGDSAERLTLRERIRRLRLYYRSGALFRERLVEPAVARWLPWRPGAQEAEIAFVSGKRLRLAARDWPLLPSACRLERIGAEFEFLADEKRIRIDGLTIHSPRWARNEANYFKEVFVDDVYGIRARDLTGKTVVDVGAYVGDTALAFARRGARVHAVEPSGTFCRFIRKNLRANGLDKRVTLHEVGLAEKAGERAVGEDRLHFVEGVAYALERLPAKIDVLKLDCEGAEYHLLGDARFLRHLAPLEIRMEYHRGAEPVLSALQRSGYAARIEAERGPVGLIRAERMQ